MDNEVKNNTNETFESNDSNETIDVKLTVISILNYFTVGQFESFIKENPQYKSINLERYVQSVYKCNSIEEAILIQDKYPNIKFILELKDFDDRIKKLNVEKLIISYNNNKHLSFELLYDTNIKEIEIKYEI